MDDRTGAEVIACTAVDAPGEAPSSPAREPGRQSRAPTVKTCQNPKPTNAASSPRSHPLLPPPFNYAQARTVWLQVQRGCLGAELEDAFMEDKQRRPFCWSQLPDARFLPVFLGSPLMIWTRCPAVTKVQSSACRLPAAGAGDGYSD